MTDFIMKELFSPSLVFTDIPKDFTTDTPKPPKILGTTEVSNTLNKAEWWRQISQMLQPGKALIVEFESYYEICLYRTTLSNSYRCPSSQSRARRMKTRMRTKRDGNRLLIWLDEEKSSVSYPSIAPSEGQK